MDPAPALAAIVAHEFRRRLLSEMLPRLRACCELLGDERIWQRPAPNCNSPGNLLLHLAGNTTQWILVPFGGLEDRRTRDAEFAADGGLSVAQLCARLAEIWTRACTLVDGLTPADLLRERTFQARYRETGLAAVLHVLEHSSGHAGQVYAWTKQVTGKDLRFYDL